MACFHQGYLEWRIRFTSILIRITDLGAAQIGKPKSLQFSLNFMIKTLYIIPGWEDTCDQTEYRNLGKAAEDAGFQVVFKNVDWKKPLSPQAFEIESDAIIFGFSLGAILAWLVAQKYECQHLILASMTPHYSFVDPLIKKELVNLAGNEFVEDIISNLDSYNKAHKQTIIYGDKENEMADILVQNTDHEINAEYIKVVIKLLIQ